MIRKLKPLLRSKYRRCEVNELNEKESNKLQIDFRCILNMIIFARLSGHILLSVTLIMTRLIILMKGHNRFYTEASI